MDRLDILNIKVFKNKYLFSYILSLVSSRDGSKYIYRKLNEFDLNIIFKNQKLFQLKYQSYLYNKNNNNNNSDDNCKNNNKNISNNNSSNNYNNDNSKLIFNQLQKYTKEFFQSSVINIEQFKLIYGDFKNEISRYSRNQLLQFCMLNQDYQLCQDQAKYLLEYQSLKFDVYHYELFIKLWWNKIKSQQFEQKISDGSGELNLLLFIINCFSNHTFNHLYKGSNKTRKTNIKQFKATIPFKILIQCIEQKKQSFFKELFDRVELLDQNGNDILIRKACSFISKRSFLIQKIIMHGSKSLAEIYCNRFPNQRCPNLHFTRNLIDENTDLQDSIDAANILSSNNTIPTQVFSYRHFSNKNIHN